MQHRTRDLLMRQCTQLINALRAHLAELGVAAAQGCWRAGLELICINGWQRAVRQTCKVYSYRVENHFPLLA